MEKYGTARRAKPAVAMVNQKNAEINIRSKINFLFSISKALERGDAVSVFMLNGAFFPCSVRQFNAWNSLMYSAEDRLQVPEFQRNANATLNKFPALLILCRQAILALRNYKERKSLRPSKDDRAKELSRLLALSESIRKIAETELAASLVRLLEAKEGSSLLEARLHSLERETAQAIESYEVRLSELQERNSILTAMLSQIAPLGGRRGR